MKDIYRLTKGLSSDLEQYKRQLQEHLEASDNFMDLSIEIPRRATKSRVDSIVGRNRPFLSQLDQRHYFAIQKDGSIIKLVPANGVFNTDFVGRHILTSDGVNHI